jgi:hypothetical protein
MEGILALIAITLAYGILYSWIRISNYGRAPRLRFSKMETHFWVIILLFLGFAICGCFFGIIFFTTKAIQILL